MRYEKLREELKNYYYNKSHENAQDFLTKCTAKLDLLQSENMSVYDM